MPNLQQIIALRRKYAPLQEISDSFNIQTKELGDYLEFQELEKAFSVEHIQPLFEHVPKTKFFAITAKKQTSNIVDYFEKQEKVHVVLLAVDITHFSSKTNSDSPQEVTERLDNYYRELMPIIYKHGGEIEKIMGDGIICIFGKPFLNFSDYKIKYRKAEECAREIINHFKNSPNEVKIALHDGPVIYYKTPTEYYEEYTMIGNTLTELYRLESVSMPNSINYYANSYYSRLKGKKPLGLVINNASCWTHSCREYALQGIGKRVVRILKRI